MAIHSVFRQVAFGRALALTALLLTIFVVGQTGCGGSGAVNPPLREDGSEPPAVDDNLIALVAHVRSPNILRTDRATSLTEIPRLDLVETTVLASVQADKLAFAPDAATRSEVVTPSGEVFTFFAIPTLGTSVTGAGIRSTYASAYAIKARAGWAVWGEGHTMSHGATPQITSMFAVASSTGVTALGLDDFRARYRFSTRRATETTSSTTAWGCSLTAHACNILVAAGKDFLCTEKNLSITVELVSCAGLLFVAPEGVAAEADLCLAAIVQFEVADILCVPPVDKVLDIAGEAACELAAGCALQRYGCHCAAGDVCSLGCSATCEELAGTFACEMGGDSSVQAFNSAVCGLLPSSVKRLACATIDEACKWGAGETFAESVAACTSTCEAKIGCDPCKGGGDPCTDDAQCCTRTCDHGQCSCRHALATCSMKGECCSGACGNDGHCACATHGDVCGGGDCCAGENCIAGLCCTIDNGPCKDAAGCCSQMCVNGRCGCANTGESCQGAGDCCGAGPSGGTISCVAGTCCGSNGAECGGADDCCGGGCEGAHCCNTAGKACTSDYQCCQSAGKGGALVCTDGVCCIAAGQACASGACCSGTCSNTGLCCAANGAACGGDSECCTGYCDGECKAAPTCEDGVKNQAEADVDCGGPCPACPPVCGQGGCEPGETCMSCAQDCGPCCGNGTCGKEETCKSCPEDCGTCPPSCGDGNCDADVGETCSTCSDDCGSCPLSCPDGSCDGAETCVTCPQDCGSCAPQCGDGKCNGGETCSSCSKDCGSCGGCGDGKCAGGENCSSCSKDCGPCGGGCGDGKCNGTETCSSCPKDCGSCGGGCGKNGDNCWLYGNGSTSCCPGQLCVPAQGSVFYKCATLGSVCNGVGISPCLDAGYPCCSACNTATDTCE